MEVLQTALEESEQECMEPECFGKPNAMVLDSKLDVFIHTLISISSADMKPSRIVFRTDAY